MIGAMECLPDKITVDALAAYARAAKMLFLTTLDANVTTRLEDEIALYLFMLRERLIGRFEKLNLACSLALHVRYLL